MSEQALSRLYKDLIEHWELLCLEAVEDLTYYATSDLLEVRKKIKDHGLEEDKRVREADIALLRHILQKGSDTPMWRPEEAPLQDWWWYLDKIALRQYPADLLPEYLAEIYLKAI